jgi:hypothetical protein
MVQAQNFIYYPKINFMQDPKTETNEESIRKGLMDANYPASEDILNPSSDLERVDIDVDNIARTSSGLRTFDAAQSTVPESDLMGDLVTADDEDDLGIVPGTEADVTKEDLLLLGPKDGDMDLGEDEDLGSRGFPLGLTGEDLDVPGEELDDANEDLGEEDEENNYYSLGGDNKEQNEEDASGADF